MTEKTLENHKVVHLWDSVTKVIVFPEEAQKFLGGAVYCQLVGL